MDAGVTSGFDIMFIGIVIAVLIVGFAIGVIIF